MTMGVRNRPEDAWERVKRGADDECWPWTGTIDHDGYGRLFVAGFNRGAHRLIYELATGEDPGTMLVCHCCDNRRCCNPAHLFLGTPADNLRDAAEKGRMPRGENAPLAKLDENKVREIRALAAAGHLQRDIAERFGVTQPNVGYIVRRETWRHVA